MKSLKDKVRIYTRTILRDNRGWFLKAITGNEDFLSPKVGEVYFTSGIQGQEKGGHFHPLAKEWFTLIQGRALLKLEDVSTQERMVVFLDAENPKTIYIPNGVAHAVSCADGCDQFILCAYTDRQYEPTDTITYKL